jgi:hypothetical protein
MMHLKAWMTACDLISICVERDAIAVGGRSVSSFGLYVSLSWLVLKTSVTMIA